MNRKKIPLLLASIAIASFSIYAPQAEMFAAPAKTKVRANSNSSKSFSRTSFDFGWKFAKFGKHDNCLARHEPGAVIGVGEASSAEGHNPASHAFDGNASTRWCAANGQPANLSVDFGRKVNVARTEIVWEQNKNYRHKIFVSSDGKTWKLAVDKANKNENAKVDSAALRESFRYAKIEVTPTGGAWASIFEWKFFDAEGKPVTPKVERNGKAPFAADFDDSSWRELNLPHDWGVESKFLPSEPNQTGSLPWNAIGWYRKELTVPAEKAGKKFYLDFDGVMMTPSVYVNGQLAGEWKYGYSSFRVDITPFLKFGEKNIIAVRCENKTNSTRWYPGAGIYRHTWLVEKNPVHIEHWGVFLTTPEIKGIEKQNGKFKAKSAKIAVETELVVPAGTKKIRVVQNIAKAGTREVLAKSTQELSSAKKIKSELSLDNVELWDIENPALYVLRTTVLANEKVVDQQDTTFGIRKAEWRANGFFLNERRVQIKGVCQHHDLGALGGAVHEKALERQIEILKSFGTNSIRTSHNPPAPELLALCDKMGILVDDELFDCWKHLKEGKVNGYNQFWNEWRERDVANLVRRDRNHPSVIAWSAGNEIEEQGSHDGVAIARELVSLFKKHDTTRPVTVGCNDIRASWNGFGKEFDVYGFNYKPNNYTDYANKNPGKPFIGSETASCVSTRGFYSFPADNNYGPFWRRNFCDNLAACQVSDYGIYAPGWAYAPDVEFAALEDEPRCAGEYVWTGFDYLGEPTPWNLGRKPANDFRGASPEEIARLQKEFAEILERGTPSRSSYFGIVDLCGFWKDRTHLYKAHWLPDVPSAHILPHWNWDGQRNGKTTPVFVYTSGDSAELFLNGKSLGRRSKKAGAKLTGKDLNGDLRERFRLTWMDVKYEPGTLEVVAYKNGKEWARSKVETTGKAEKMKVELDCNKTQPILAADGRDLAYFRIDVLDSKGRTVPTASNRLHFSVSGPFEIVGVCNGDPTDHESMKGNTLRAFNGLAQVIVRSKRGESGTGTLNVRGEGIGSQTIKLKSVPAK